VRPSTSELLPRPAQASPSSQLTTRADVAIGATEGIGAIAGMGAITSAAPLAPPAHLHVAVVMSPVCADDTAQDSQPAAQQKVRPLTPELLRPSHAGPSSQPLLTTFPPDAGDGMGGNGAKGRIGAMGGMGAMVGIGAIVGMGGMGAIRGMGDGTPCASPAPPMQTHVAVME